MGVRLAPESVFDMVRCTQFEATSGSFVFVERAPEALLNKSFDRAVVDLLDAR